MTSQLTQSSCRGKKEFFKQEKVFSKFETKMQEAQMRIMFADADNLIPMQPENNTGITISTQYFRDFSPLEQHLTL